MELLKSNILCLGAALVSWDTTNELKSLTSESSSKYLKTTSKSINFTLFFFLNEIILYVEDLIGPKCQFETLWINLGS